VGIFINCFGETVEQRIAVVEISEYMRERLREDEEFILYRGRASEADVTSVLLLTPPEQ
jgi:hypothetical protein